MRGRLGRKGKRRSKSIRNNGGVNNEEGNRKKREKGYDQKKDEKYRTRGQKDNKLRHEEFDIR